MHFDSDNRWPRYHSSGNLVFGGLPASCGPEVAVQHVIAIGRLGQIVGSQEHLSERNVREHVDRFNATSALPYSLSMSVDQFSVRIPRSRSRTTISASPPMLPS